jgi:SAM-dependent methyltransferase
MLVKALSINAENCGGSAFATGTAISSPNGHTQVRYTGNSEDGTLHEGFTAYRIFKDCYETHVGKIADCRGILDFGCGWGRIIRFFLRDVLPEKISGVDHSSEAIHACRETNKWCKFALIEPDPPTLLASNSFDLIYLYSVFSHLPEEMHLALLRDFERLLIPGGLLVATTRGREFIHNDP